MWVGEGDTYVHAHVGDVRIMLGAPPYPRWEGLPKFWYLLGLPYIPQGPWYTGKPKRTHIRTYIHACMHTYICTYRKSTSRCSAKLCKVVVKTLSTSVGPPCEDGLRPVLSGLS